MTGAWGRGGATSHTQSLNTHSYKAKANTAGGAVGGGGGGGAAPTNLKGFYRWMRFVTEPPSDKRQAGVNKLHAGNGWSRAHVFPIGRKKGKEK